MPISEMGQSIFFEKIFLIKIYKKLKNFLNFDYELFFLLHTVHTGIPVSIVTSTFDEWQTWQRPFMRKKIL